MLLIECETNILVFERKEIRKDVRVVVHNELEQNGRDCISWMCFQQGSKYAANIEKEFVRRTV